MSRPEHESLSDASLLVTFVRTLLDDVSPPVCSAVENVVRAAYGEGFLAGAIAKKEAPTDTPEAFRRGAQWAANVIEDEAGRLDEAGASAAATHVRRAGERIVESMAAPDGKC